MHGSPAHVGNPPSLSSSSSEGRVTTIERCYAGSVLDTIVEATPVGRAFVIHVPPGAPTESPPRRDGMLDAMGRFFEWRGGTAVRVGCVSNSTPNSVFAALANLVAPDWRTLPRYGVPAGLLARNLWARACSLNDRPLLVLISNADSLLTRDHGETARTLAAIAQLPRSKLRGVVLDADAPPALSIRAHDAVASPPATRRLRTTELGGPDNAAGVESMRSPKLGHLPGYYVLDGRLFLTSPWVAATCDTAIASNGFTDRISLEPRARTPVVRDAKTVERAYAAHGLSLPTAVAFVTEATKILDGGRHLIVGGARDGECETLAACLLASIDELSPRVAKYRLLRRAREASRKVSGQASPPMEPTVHQAVIEAFVATSVIPTPPARPSELLAHAQSIADQPFLTDEGYLAAVESLDWLIGDPHDGERAFALQVELSRRLRAGSRTPWPSSWADRRAEWIHHEDDRPKTDADVIADALAFNRPELFDELALRRALTQGGHATAASAWHAKAASARDEDARRCHEKAAEHFVLAAEALAPEALQQWGRTLRELARNEDAILGAIAVLRRVPVGPNYASTLEDVANATVHLRGDEDPDALQQLIEAAWYAALADDDRVRAASTLMFIAKNPVHPLALDALAALFHIATKTRHRRTLQRAIDAATSCPVLDERLHDRALLETLALSLASACANLADKRDALLAAAGHARAQAARDTEAEKRAKRYRTEAQRLPTHPTCSIGVPQREW